MYRELVDGSFVVAPVLHKLGWRLHSIPLNSSDSCHQAFILGREHVLESMAELMEESLDFTESHQGRLVAYRRRLIANHVGDREANSVFLRAHHSASSRAHIHPSASSLLLWAGVRVKVEVCGDFPVSVDLPQLDILVPHSRLALGRHHLHVEESLGQLEESVEDPRQREVRANFLLVERVERFSLSLCIVGCIPGLQLPFETLGLGKCLQIFELLLCKGIR
mmetsp:Transcript_5049/g.18169  ORF Transcript_5049/g.18169 Transcript_5049/m.18169 type:complete len:222 (-) Transcript_5049:1275-1940(-)